MARNRPTDAELLDAVVEFLATKVEPEVSTPDVRFRLRVAMNVLGIVRRECQLGAAHDARERDALAQLLGASAVGLDELNRLLCRRLRQGDFDGRLGEVLPVLTSITMDKLSIDNPRFSTYMALK